METNTRGSTYSVNWVREFKGKLMMTTMVLYGTVWATLRLHMDNLTTFILSICLEEDTVLITCLYLLYLRLFCSYMNCWNDPIQSRRGRKKLKQAKLVQFSTYWTETGQGVHYNSTYNMIWPFDCTVLPSYSLKKERLCLKIVLGQAWFELYCTVIIFFCTHSTWIWIGRASPSQSSLWFPVTAFL